MYNNKQQQQQQQQQQQLLLLLLLLLPFDVVGGLGNEKSLRIAIKFELGSRVDRDARL